jgi:hypothetical protein
MDKGRFRHSDCINRVSFPTWQVYFNSYFHWFGVDVNSLDLPAYSSLVAPLNTLLSFVGAPLPVILTLSLLLVAVILYGLPSFKMRSSLGRGQQRI